MDFGSNIFEWIQNQAFYLALTVIVVLTVIALFKKATTQLIAILVIGGIAITMIRTPETIGDLGQSLFRTIFG